MEIVKTLNFKKESSSVLFTLLDLRNFISESFPMSRDPIELTRVVVNKVTPESVDNGFDASYLYWSITGSEIDFEPDQNKVSIEIAQVLKHTRKVMKKQIKVAEMWDRGERIISNIVKKLRVRKELVSFTIRHYRNFNEIEPY